MFSYQAANLAEHTVFFPPPYKKKEEPRNKQTPQWHTFACYVCCEAQDSIKHLKICETHLKEPHSCLQEEKKKREIFGHSISVQQSKGCLTSSDSLEKEKKKEGALLPQRLDSLKAQWGEMSLYLYICHIRISAWGWMSVFGAHRATAKLQKKKKRSSKAEGAK